MSRKMVLAYPLQKRPDETDPYRAGIEMPIGGLPLMMTPYGEGALGIVSVVDPHAVVIWHPLIVAPVGIEFEMMLGRRIGAFIGAGTINGDGVAVFREEPWPMTALEGVETRGVG